MKTNSGTKIGVGAKAQTGAKISTAVRSEAVPVGLATSPTNYVNRELSWLELNYRMFNESKDKNIPLLEHLKFLSITVPNPDGFYVVRVASLKDMVHAKYTKLDITGLMPREQLDRISKRTHELAEMQCSTYNRSLVPTLRQNGLRMITEHEDMTEGGMVYMDKYFRGSVYPALTPMAFDSPRPSPLIRSKTPNIATFLKKKSGEDKKLGFTMTQIPSIISRIAELPREIGEDGEERRVVVLLEEIIKWNMPSLFLNHDIMASYPFRIMRSTGLTIDKEEAVGLLEEIQKQLKKRQWDEAVRLEIEDNVDKRLLKIIRRELSIDNQDILEINGPLDLTFLMKIYGLEGFELFKAPRYMPQPVPALMNEGDIFTNIRRGDVLLHHPHQSFGPVVNFVRSAVRGQPVLTTKQTLYRVSGDSPIIAALAKIADNGKQVLALVGLKACSDEKNNINWAKMPEKAGCYITYGLVGPKTHSKITLVVRMEEDRTRHYVHLGTSNCNDSTAKLYTDCDILTYNPQIGKDTTAVFNMLSGYSEPLARNKLSVAPLWLRRRFLRMIRREAKHAREGKPAHTMAKMDSPRDREVVTVLYEASYAGVKMETIIRGTCCLKAGVPGLNENISVRSIVGNLLERSRISYFFNDASPEVYMDNADWMSRNLDRWVEIISPVENGVLRGKAIHILGMELEDNVKAYIPRPDGSYEEEDKRGKVLVNSQEQSCREAILMVKKSTDQEDPVRSRVFKSIMSNSQERFERRRPRKNIQDRIA